MKTSFSFKTEVQLRDQNPIALAFVGDAIQSLFVREWLVCSRTSKAHALHVLSSQIVSAVSQSKSWDKIEPLLTESEKEVALRARNTHFGAKAKNATNEEYHRATMLEAVLGWNHLLGNHERVEQILLLTLPSEEMIFSETKPIKPSKK